MSVEATLHFEPGAPLFRDRDPATHLYLVQAGSVEGRIGPQIMTFSEGQLLGDGGIVSGHYRMTAVAGAQGCTVLKIPVQDLTEELAHCPPLVRLLVSNLLGRQEIATTLLKDRS